MFPLLCILMMLAAGPTLGATTPAQRAAAIAPFVDEQTVAVGYVNLDALAPDAVSAEMERAGVPKEMVTTATAVLKKYLDSLAGAGVHELYAVVSTSYLLDAPVAVVAPLPQGTDPAAGVAVLRQVWGSAAAINGAVVAAPQRVLNIIRQGKAMPRPELEAAFAAAGDAPVVGILLPTADNRRVIEETLPVLPAYLGGGPSTVLTRGVMWTCVALRLAAPMSLDVTVQSADVQAAQTLAEKLPQFRQTLLQRAESEPNEQALKALLTALGPVARGDRVVLHLGADELRTVIGQLLVPAARKARSEAASSQSANQMRQILLAAAMYVEKHKEWPDDLKQLVVPFLSDKALLRNPDRGDLEVGYEYRKPAKDAPSATAVLWEKYEHWPGSGANVGYVDGAVELVSGPERFQQILQKGR